MAKSRRYNQRKTSKKQSYAKRIKQLACDMGAIHRGLNNPKSMVSAAWKKGNELKQRDKKTLF